MMSEVGGRNAIRCLRDERYNERLAALKAAMKELAVKIQPKVYEYGFLKK